MCKLGELLCLQTGAFIDVCAFVRKCVHVCVYGGTML